MKKILSLIILLACSSNTYSIDSMKIQAYAELIKAKSQAALAEAKIAFINTKEKMPKSLDNLQSACNNYLEMAKDKLSSINKNNSTDSKLENVIKEAKKISDSAVIYAKENPNTCIVAGVTTACFITYYIYKKCYKNKTN